MRVLRAWGVVACLVAAPALLSGCGGDGTRPVFVYVMSNSAQANEIIVFRADENGDLIPAGVYPTGGLGSGTMEVSAATPQDGVNPLASQGALALSRGGDFLFAVNAGDDRVSSFRVDDVTGTLALVDIAPSGGHLPNCLDSVRNFLYVANAGNPALGIASNLRGFRVEKLGGLTPIPGATYSLSTQDALASRVLFSPGGELLTVSELTTNSITVYAVDFFDGRLTLLAANPSSGPGPAGSLFLRNGTMVVAEAEGTFTGAVSSYAAGSDGVLSVVSPSVSSSQSGTCWVAVTPGEAFVYTSNTGPGTLSLFRVVQGDQIFLLQQIASTLDGPGSGPIDLAVGGRTLYVLEGGMGAITALQIQDDGSLGSPRTFTHSAIPALGAQGLVVW